MSSSIGSSSAAEALPSPGRTPRGQGGPERRRWAFPRRLCLPVAGKPEKLRHGRPRRGGSQPPDNEKKPADFAEVLADPKRGSLLTTGGFLMELALGTDVFIRTKPHPNGAGGLLFAVQTGYRLAPGWGKWTMPDLEIAGGPKLGLTGFYVRLLFGGSRRFY